jgi:hypothetical protein
VGEGGDEVSVARFIADQRTFYAVPHAVSCRLLEVSEAWFYKWIKAPTTVRGARRALLDEAVRKAFVASKGSYGSPRIYEDLIDPELPHPELVDGLDGHAADVVTLPVPTAERSVDDLADEVPALPAKETTTAGSTPDPLSGAVLAARSQVAPWCGGCR